MRTVILDRDIWDLVLDTEGNIAVASDPYSIAQDICSAVRLFIGELWYDTTKGIPYFTEILGQALPVEILKTRIVDAALSVPQVLSAECIITAFADRRVTGQVQFTYGNQAVTSSSSGGPVSSVVTFIGDNSGIVTFIGDNTFPLTFTG